MDPTVFSPKPKIFSLFQPPQLHVGHGVGQILSLWLFLFFYFYPLWIAGGFIHFISAAANLGYNHVFLMY